MVCLYKITLLWARTYCTQLVAVVAVVKQTKHVVKQQKLFFRLPINFVAGCKNVTTSFTFWTQSLVRFTKKRCQNFAYSISRTL